MFYSRREFVSTASLGAMAAIASPFGSAAGGNEAAEPPLAKVPFSPEQAKRHQTAWAKHFKTEIVRENVLGMRFIFIPPGTFKMGTADGGRDNERPQHEVTLTGPYYMCDREVTVEQFQQFIDDADYSAAAKPQGWPGVAKNWSPTSDCPVQNVNWFDAVLFCNWLSVKDGRKPAYERTGEKRKQKVDNTEFDVWNCDFVADGYRLPTEAEWEFACRAGSSGAYCCGDDDAQLPRFASISSNAKERTWPAATRLANSWGLFDMHGNVWEWCWDWQRWYAAGPEIDPIGSKYTGGRVLRGGAFISFLAASECRSARRQFYLPNYRGDLNGFRVSSGR